MSRHHAWIYALVAICSASCEQTSANERVKSAVGQLAGEDMLVAAAIELDGRWVSGLQQEIAKRVGEEGNVIAGSPAFAMTLGFIESFRSAGAKELVVVLGASDLNPNAGPIVAIATDSPEQARQVQQLFEGLRGMMPKDVDLASVQQDSLVLLGLKPTVDRYAGREQTNEVAAAEQLAILLGEVNQAEGEQTPAFALLVAPGEEPRRVIRELWPTLPKPFNNISGELLADDVHYLSVLLTCPPDWQLRVTADTANEQTAEQLEQAIQASWGLLAQQLTNGPAAEVFQPAIDILKRTEGSLAPMRYGSKLEVTASHDDPEIVELTAAVLVPPIEAAREAARRNARLNNLKQLALAMFNFESAIGSFPAAEAFLDRNGKPLLSWRVAVLPFIDRQMLHKQFHFDEPWDSPHNLTLLKQMPDVFKDSAHPELAAEGKTTYLVPTHPQSAFPPANGEAVKKTTKFVGQEVYLAPGTELRDITDGTSLTLMIVQVPPELAVPWTKPADWEVDLANAWQQLRGSGRRPIPTAFCDGSARILDLENDKDLQNLPKFITRNGKEVVEY